MIKKIEILYDQGTAERVEDGAIINPPFFGVVDGFSAPYYPGMKQTLFNNLTGGEMIRKVALETFYSAKSGKSLEELVLKANAKIAKIQSKKGIPLNQPDLLAGASFAFAKIKKRKIEMILGGDCYAFWIRNSKAEMTKNQAQNYERKVAKKLKELLKKHQGNRIETWKEFIPILAFLRKKYFNKEFAILNGQDEIKNCWKRIEIPTEKLKWMILFTDGFWPFQYLLIDRKTGFNEDKEEFKKLFLKGGLQEILNFVRKIEEKKKKENYIDHQEATAIAINLPPRGFFIFVAGKK